MFTHQTHDLVSHHDSALLHRRTRARRESAYIGITPPQRIRLLFMHVHLKRIGASIAGRRCYGELDIARKIHRVVGILEIIYLTRTLFAAGHCYSCLGDVLRIAYHRYQVCHLRPLWQ